MRRAHRRAMHNGLRSQAEETSHRGLPGRILILLLVTTTFLANNVSTGLIVPGSSAIRMLARTLVTSYLLMVWPKTGALRPLIPAPGPPPIESRLAIISEGICSLAALRFSRRCSTEDVPGINRMFGDF